MILGTDPWRLLPHELFFGLFLVITWARLCATVGFAAPDALFYAAMIAGWLWSIWFCRARDTPRTWRLGLLFYPLAMNLVFQEMRTGIPAIHPESMDSWLQSVDAHLIGTNLSLRLEPLVHPVLTELFSLCYLLFFPYLLIGLIDCFCGQVQVLQRFVIGLFTVYGIGFLGYSFVPAANPCHAMADRFAVPLTGGWLTQWNAAIVAAGSNGVDVFPSLHCAVSCYLLFFDLRHRPRRFRLYLLPCVGLWLSTIYLRYHYFVDVVCGFALAAFAIRLARRFPLPPPTTDAIARPLH
jgi:membrane-associated phospholipid phosphatase